MLRKSSHDIIWSFFFAEQYLPIINAVRVWTLCLLTYSLNILIMKVFCKEIVLMTIKIFGKIDFH